MVPEELPHPLRVALEIAGILNRLAIPYVTAGSFASSLYGEPRSTDDVDVVADLHPPHATRLLTALGRDWYVMEGAVRDAIAKGGTFTLIHLPTAVKVDVFVVGSDEFDAHRVSTGHLVRLSDDPVIELRFDTPEHTVLRKLDWYRRRGANADRHWRDVVGVLRSQGARLDRRELTTWAERLGVAEQLARAADEARYERS